MPSIHQDMAEFRRRLEKGAIRDAYRALLAYMPGLRAHFKKRYLEMTCFALVPPALYRPLPPRRQ